MDEEGEEKLKVPRDFENQGPFQSQAVPASSVSRKDSKVPGRIRGILLALGLGGAATAAVASTQPGPPEVQPAGLVPISTPDIGMAGRPQVELSGTTKTTVSVPNTALQPGTAARVEESVHNAEQKNDWKPNPERLKSTVAIVGAIQEKNMAESSADSDTKRKAIPKGGPSPAIANEGNPQVSGTDSAVK